MRQESAEFAMGHYTEKAFEIPRFYILVDI